MDKDVAKRVADNKRRIGKKRLEKWEGQKNKVKKIYSFQ